MTKLSLDRSDMYESGLRSIFLKSDISRSHHSPEWPLLQSEVLLDRPLKFDRIMLRSRLDLKLQYKPGQDVSYHEQT